MGNGNSGLTTEEVALLRGLMSKLGGDDQVVRVKPRQMTQGEFDEHVEEQNARTKREQDFAANPMQAHFDLEDRVKRLEQKMDDHAAETEMAVSHLGDKVNELMDPPPAPPTSPAPSSPPSKPPAGA